METQKSICEWADSVFGTVSSNFRVATRANEEMAELLRCLALGEEQHAKAAEEAADVAIVLCRLATRLGVTCSFGFPGDHPTVARRAARFGVMASANLGIAMSFLEHDDNASGVAGVVQACIGWLATLANLLGTTLQAEIDKKMAINRAREWKLDGTGHGYHVKKA